MLFPVWTHHSSIFSHWVWILLWFSRPRLIFQYIFPKSFAVENFLANITKDVFFKFIQNINVGYCLIEFSYQCYHNNLIFQTVYTPMHNSYYFFYPSSSSTLLSFETVYILQHRVLALDVFFIFCCSGANIKCNLLLKLIWGTSCFIRKCKS